MIKQMGEQGFKNSPYYKELKDPDVPLYFSWIFARFVEMYNGCGESLTWTEIINYGKIRKIDFKQYEVDFILKCNSWANSKIKELREENK